MQKTEIGAYTSYTLERGDVVVLMGDSDGQEERLQGLGFQKDEETREWVGTGASLYEMAPDEFFDLFSGGQGSNPLLTAQATDGENVFQIDGLPVVVPGTDGQGVIEEITAVDVEMRNIIDEGVSNFKVG